MNVGNCPILTRYVTDLYNTLPEGLTPNIDGQSVNEVAIDEAYIQKRMFLCADFCWRVLLPHTMRDRPKLAKSVATIQSLPISDGEGLIAAHNYLQKVYRKLNTLVMRGPKAVRPDWLYIESVAHATQWVLEAALYGSAVIGPLTVNIIDTIADKEEGWDNMFPLAKQMLNDLLRVEFYVN